MTEREVVWTIFVGVFGIFCMAAWCGHDNRQYDLEKLKYTCPTKAASSP